MPETNKPLEINILYCPASEFEGLTFLRFRPLLTKRNFENPDEDCLIVGAVDEDKPVGLALFSRPYDDSVRRLLSVFVSRRYRRQGIGLRLLTKGEQGALEMGTKKLVAFHSSQMKNLENYEGLMQKAGWSNPALYEFRAGSKVKWVYQAEQDWKKFITRMERGGFNTTTWQDLTDVDREQIANLVAHELPESDRPFDPLHHNLPEFLAALSVVLRCGQEIVGWVLGSKGAQENTYYYTHGYVLPKYQKRGYLIMGMVAVCRRQAELFGAETVSAYETRVTGMHRVMQRMMPYTDWADERFVCEKMLVE